nr:mannose-1-phosphate guanyltransferase alpha-A isoform X2 [Danaus plexippus plexippus]
MLKAVILIGGPQKGTRFRPLSLDTPKPLFPIAGLPLIQHHIAACVKLGECKEVLIIGSYTTTTMAQFVSDMQKEYKIIIRYLQEFTPLGTGGGLYHFRDQIRAGNPTAFFLLNGDVCADFPLKELWTFHEKTSQSLITIMGTEATRQQSVHYGCIVREPTSNSVTHYVEKPNSYISTLINCGVYVCSLQIFHTMADAFQRKQEGFYSGNGQNGSHPGYMSWEQDVLAPLAGTNKVFALQVTNWWSQVKTAGSAIYANRHYLELHPSTPATTCHIIPDVYIHPTATVHSSAVIGPNVSIGAGVTIQAGVRIKESIVLNNATVHEHALVMYTVVGQEASVGEWSRVEGTPSDPDPNKPFAKMDNTPLFNSDGRLNPSITILGAGVVVPDEMILLNSIVLPHKHLTRSFKHEIIL